MLLGLGAMIPLFAEAPEELKKSPVADLAAEANAQIEDLGTWTASEAAFKEKRDDIRRSASVVAVLGQAIAEHPEGQSQKLSRIAMRDAAMKLASIEDQQEAVRILTALKTAASGKAEVATPETVAWADLIDMADLMHVINTRNAQVVRAARRSRDPEGDSRHALTIAMLTLVMAEQAEDYLSKEEDIKAWKKYAKDFQTGMTDLAAAIKAQDKANVQKHLAASTKACNDCHAQFRPEPEKK
jgi:hypothetical protein